MNPNQAQQGPQVFNQSHHDAYEALRGIAMKFHMMGVPGMDQALNGINAAHAKAIGQGRLATPGGYPAQQMGQTAMGEQMPQGPIPANYGMPGQAQAVNQGLTEAPQQFGQQVPQAYGPGY